MREGKEEGDAGEREEERPGSSSRAVARLGRLGERRRKGREEVRAVDRTWKDGGNEGKETRGGGRGNGRGSAKPRCRRFGFGKSAFVGNRARLAREGRDQWP